jgi:hypothetical protein
MGDLAMQKSQDVSGTGIPVVPITEVRDVPPWPAPDRALAGARLPGMAGRA